jgi:CelD/BcsL family acetyltransferase involved in cellulose biosynthesis
MDTSVRVIDPAVDGRWDAYVDNVPASSVFQHSSWKTVIERTFGGTPLYLAAGDGSGPLRAAIPFFLKKGLMTGTSLVSLPYADYCDILAGDPDTFRELWRAAVDLGERHGARSIEVRAREGGGGALEHLPVEKGETYLNHFLDIGDDLGFIEKKVIEKSYRYDIRHAVKSGLVVKAADDARDMAEYYRLYVMTRRHHGLPPMPFAFFRHVWEVMRPLGMVHLFLAYWVSQPVAGIIFLQHRNCLYALSNSSDRRFLDKKPNHLLWWRGIQLAVETGLTGLDFGRTSHDNKGLLFFKRRWGTREITLRHYRLDLKPRAHRPGVADGRIRSMAPLILRRFPPWALRAVGNVVYRFV